MNTIDAWIIRPGGRVTWHPSGEKPPMLATCLIDFPWWSADLRYVDFGFRLQVVILCQELLIFALLESCKCASIKILHMLFAHHIPDLFILLAVYITRPFC